MDMEMELVKMKLPLPKNKAMFYNKWIYIPLHYINK
jgi:hypothetical protein